MSLRWLNSNLHRDIGYFLSGLIVIYCISGIALNHVNDWNPDFIIQKRTVQLGGPITKESISAERLKELSRVVDEGTPKVHDFPTADQVKIYYDNATLSIDMPAGIGHYERVMRRPVIYHVNVLHRNSLKGWKWASDVFALLLIFITISGWFMLRGKYGLGGRGKWLIAAGMAPPVAALVIFQLVQK